MAAVAAGVLVGARSLIAITQWIADAPYGVLRALGFPIDPFTRAVTVPHPTTVMRLLSRLDGDAFDTAVSAILPARAQTRRAGTSRLRAVAVDGKQLRGSRAGGGKAVWLLAAMDHTGTVIAQRQIDAKSNETPVFIPLLNGRALANTVVTADAADTQHANGHWPRDHGAHYVAVVKSNHPALLRQLTSCPGRASAWITRAALAAGAGSRSGTSRPRPLPIGLVLAGVRGLLLLDECALAADGDDESALVQQADSRPSGRPRNVELCTYRCF